MQPFLPVPLQVWPFFLHPITSSVLVTLASLGLISLKKLSYFISRLCSSNFNLPCSTHCSRLSFFSFSLVFLHILFAPIHLISQFPPSSLTPAFHLINGGFPAFPCTCILSHSLCPSRPNFLLQTSPLHGSQLLCCPSCSSSPCTRSSGRTCNSSCIHLNISTLKGVQENMCLIFIFVCSLQK